MKKREMGIYLSLRTLDCDDLERIHLLNYLRPSATSFWNRTNGSKRYGSSRTSGRRIDLVCYRVHFVIDGISENGIDHDCDCNQNCGANGILREFGAVFGIKEIF